MVDPQIPGKDVLATLEKALGTLEYERPNPWAYLQFATLLLERKLKPARAMGFLRQAVALSEEETARDGSDDTMLETDRAENEKNAREMRAGLRHSMLKAAMLMNKPEEVAGLKGVVEGPVPVAKKDFELYWQDRARFAVLQGRKIDALSYYQTAPQSRGWKTPRWREGRLVDDLSDEAKALWKELGGTEMAYQHWSAPPAAVKGTEAGESVWDRPKKLPQFELADVSGKTWKLKQLEGKAALINLWATWCGPCPSELPDLQKLYEAEKWRANIQVLSFNIDDDVGLVQPFVAEKKYTFPVLLANDLVKKLYDGGAIPQYWLIDPAGKWRWVGRLKKPDKMD